MRKRYTAEQIIGLLRQAEGTQDQQMSTTMNTIDMRPMTQDEIAAVAGGTQLYSHQFTYINYQNGGLRSFEPSLAAANNDATCPVAK